MIAQKLKNNKIAITSGNSGRKDAIQTIEDLRVGEFFKLSRASRNWEKSLNDKRDIMFTTYENEHSKVCKEFDAIYQKRQFWKEYLNKKVEEEYTIENETKCVKTSNKEENLKEKSSHVKTYYKSNVVGTSRLIKLESKKTIKIVKRKGSKDATNRANSVCINNKLREEFFFDCKSTSTFNKANKIYEIVCTEKDKDLYEKWDSIIKGIFEKGL